MKTFTGKIVNSGYALAKVRIIPDMNLDIKMIRDCDCTEELNRLGDAISSVTRQLEQMRDKFDAQKSADKREGADIIETHLVFLADKSEESLIGHAEKIIKDEKVNAEYALKVAGCDLAGKFAEGKSEYLSARNEDIGHLTRMLTCKLMNIENEVILTEDSIILAEELSPEELTSLEAGYVKGIVTKKGSPLSHTSIIAGNMNVPYLTGMDFEGESSLDKLFENGGLSAIDAKKGQFIYEPDEKTCNEIKECIRNQEKEAEEITENASEAIASSPIKLYANIGNPNEVEKATANHAMGIGLFRSEFLYMDSDEVPDEETQYRAYVRALDAMEGKPVIVRTIDIGADKEAKCLSMPTEANPALGLRGIRISFANPELFNTQLRALLRAAYNRNLKIMFPMIASKWEVQKAKDAVKQTAEELKREGIDCSIPPIGIMVETPAAVMIMDELAPLVDFVSIGTNDLTQYTIALDRCSDNLAEYYDAHHEAVLRLIEMTCKEAHKYNVEVGICGELGSDMELAERFYKMGIDELSMASSKIPAAAYALKKVKEQNESNMILGICAPVEGYLIPMEDIPDDTFSNGLMGQCVGIYPGEGIITAPIDGVISMVAKTKHAFSIKSQDAEVLVHVGIDTVEMNGKGFECNLSEGREVKTGEEMMRFDIDAIKEAGFEPIVVVVKLS